MAIAETETYLAAWPNPQTQQKLLDLKADYLLMEDHWRQGTNDPQREELYQRLLQRLYVLAANISIYKHMNGSSYLQTLYKGVRQEGKRWSIATIKGEMENFVSEVADIQAAPAGDECPLQLRADHAYVDGERGGGDAGDAAVAHH